MLYVARERRFIGTDDEPVQWQLQIDGENDRRSVSDCDGYTCGALDQFSGEGN